MFEKTIEIFWEELLKSSPAFFWAGLVLLLGIFVGRIVERICSGFLDKLRLNQILKRIGFEESFKKLGFEVDASKIISEIVEWFFIIIFLLASSDILSLVQFSQFLERVIGYFPNIFISILIFIISAFLIDFSQKVFIGSLEKEKLTFSRFFGKGFTLSVWVLATLAIFYQLRIIPELILAIFIGTIAIIVLVLGISFGLGGKDLAAKILKELEEKLK
jgi:hypothetical protein